jgi:hypothetical protein
MPPFPLPLESMLGHVGALSIYVLIGFAFGYVLEISGFAISTRLAAQFYFKDMTVLKVMFTGIIVAMVLIFFTTALGWLDFNLIWVNPTYLWPGIVGGLIMGVGFIVGGFCPGTSLVSVSTFKIDGLFFALGTLFGIFVFGETVQYFEDFWNSSYYGRVTIMDWLNLPTGVVVVGVVLMALFMFWGAELLERRFGGKEKPQRTWGRMAGVGALVAGAVLVLILGQPTTQDKWVRLAPEKETLLAERAVQIHPGELLTSLADNQLNVVMLDVRDEADYNLFHIRRARHLPLDDVAGGDPCAATGGRRQHRLCVDEQRRDGGHRSLEVDGGGERPQCLHPGRRAEQLAHRLRPRRPDPPAHADATGRRSVAVHVYLGAGRPLCRRRPGPASF